MGELKLLSSQLHDWYFDIEAVRFTERNRTLLIQLEPSKKDLLHPRGLGVVLVIANVARIRVVDTERIGLYDIYGIEHEPPMLRIVANVPLIFDAEVSELAIKVETSRESELQ